MAVFARRVTDTMGDNAPAPPASNELRAEPQLVLVMGGFNSKQTHESARQAVEAVAVKAGLNDDMVTAMSVEIALPPTRNGAVLAFVTCANMTATDILYPLPEDESAPIPVRRIDMRPTPVYAKIVLSATDAAHCEKWQLSSMATSRECRSAETAASAVLSTSFRGAMPAARYVA